MTANKGELLVYIARNKKGLTTFYNRFYPLNIFEAETEDRVSTQQETLNDTLRGNFPTKPQPTERTSEIFAAEVESLQWLGKKRPTCCRSEAAILIASRVQFATYSLGNDTLHCAGERSRHAEASVVQDVHCHLEAAAQLAQQTVGRNAHVVKVDLSRVGRLDSHLLLWRSTMNEHSEAM